MNGCCVPETAGVPGTSSTVLPAADVPGSGTVLPAAMLPVADPRGISGPIAGEDMDTWTLGCTPGNMSHTFAIPGNVSPKAVSAAA